MRFYMLTNMTLSAATPANRRSDRARRSSRSWRHRRPERTKRAEGSLSPAVLIYGSAIKTPTNPPKFINMQFSNRRQTRGQAIESLIIVEEIRVEQIRPDGALSTKFLIATFTKLEFESSHCKHSSYQNSNRNKLALSANVARVFRPEAFPPNLGFPRAECYFVCANRTCQSSPPNGRERPNETCENRIT
jgi:hypothetical protein